jgi:hypothetical protein
MVSDGANYHISKEGNLMKKQTGVIGIVAVDCRPDQEEKLNKWYSERHIPDLMKFKGLKKATRFELIPAKASPGYPEVKYPKFITIFEYEDEEGFKAYSASPELAATQPDVKSTWEKDPYKRVWRMQYKVTKTWENK